MAAERLDTEAPGKKGNKTKSLTAAMATVGCSEQGVRDAQHAALMPSRLLQETPVDPPRTSYQCLLAPKTVHFSSSISCWTSAT